MFGRCLPATVTGLRSDALSLVRGRERGAATSKLEMTIARVRDADDKGRLTSLEPSWSSVAHRGRYSSTTTVRSSACATASAADSASSRLV